MRYRTKLVQMRSAEENRLIALLEKANIKLSTVMARNARVSADKAWEVSATRRALLASITYLVAGPPLSLPRD